MVAPNVLADVWARVDVRGPDECWPWAGPLVAGGYGRMDVGGVRVRSNRAAYELGHGRPPVGHVCHTCDVPACCNPRHLYDGDDATNARDREARGRGHDRSGEANGRAVLTAEDVAAIRAEYGRGGVRQVELAARYGVTQRAVSKLLRGQTWAHVRTEDRR